MGDHFWRNFSNWGVRARQSKKEKKNITVLMAILIFSMGVFFCPNSAKTANGSPINAKTEVSLDKLVPEKKIGTYVYEKLEGKEKKDIASCAQLKESASKKEKNKISVYAMVSGHPIEDMIPYIEKRDKKVASYLVAIAKKESNWGKRSPVKSGRNCYNYWGYRGGYNMTDSGYSCFDSPEQAVREVGDRIEELLGQQINTPSQMIVWKCGRTCAGHDPQDVKKWISDVASYYGKLNS